MAAATLSRTLRRHAEGKGDFSNETHIREHFRINRLEYKRRRNSDAAKPKQKHRRSRNRRAK